MAITFAYALDAIHAMFADEAMVTSQSDVGRFQTRAAEMLGGPFGQLTVQPGVRAVLEKVSRSGTGLSLHQLKGELRRSRGQWPDELLSFRSTVDNYVDATINHLLASGLLVPMLDVHSSHCRVESQVLPRDLDTAVRWELYLFAALIEAGFTLEDVAVPDFVARSPYGALAVEATTVNPSLVNGALLEDHPPTPTTRNASTPSTTCRSGSLGLSPRSSQSGTGTRHTSPACPWPSRSKTSTSPCR